MIETALPMVQLGDPVLVAQGPSEEKRWGWYQFPSIERHLDGRLLVKYQRAADSALSYGEPPAVAVSNDEGLTWEPAECPDDPLFAHSAWGGGVLLPNGDRLQVKMLHSLPADRVSLPPSIGHEDGTYGNTYDYYPAADLPPEMAGYHFLRRRAGTEEWVEETATVRIPGAIRNVTEGVLTFPWIDRLRVGPDGTLWGIHYWKRVADYELLDKWAVFLLRSTDYGHTFDLHGEIRYRGDPLRHPGWTMHEGFTEPDVAFLPDGSLFCLMRTTDGIGVGPLYASRSTDGGRAWSRPKVFDDRGVWPQLLTLGNGVTLAAYGRPGLYVRATADPAAQAWGPRAEVLRASTVWSGTCAYSGLLALDDRTALLVYSDFAHPGEDGQLCKAIKVRRVTVEV